MMAKLLILLGFVGQLHASPKITVALKSIAEVRKERLTICAGVIIANHVLTAAHCISLKTDFTSVRLNGKIYATKLKKIDSHNDLALLEFIEPFAAVGLILSEEAPNLLDRVYSIGHPYTRTKVVHAGFVIKLEDPCPAPYIIYESCTMTNLGIRPGDSGGALLDRRGKLIGIASFYTPSSNYGFFVGYKPLKEFLRNVTPSKR